MSRKINYYNSNESLFLTSTIYLWLFKPLLRRSNEGEPDNISHPLQCRTSFKEGLSLHSKIPFTDQPFGRCWKHWFLKNQWKNLINKKAGNVTFLAKIFLSICRNTYIWIIWDFLNFRKSRLSKDLWVVVANPSDRLPRNFLSVVRNLFVTTHQNFVTRSFFQRKIEKLKKLILAKKS